MAAGITTDLFWPFDTSTVSEWPGSSVGRSEVHMGTDFAIPQGTPLRATAAGRVIRYGGNTGGWGVDIVSPGGLIVRNWHLSRIDVVNGSTVAVGDVLGLTGGALGTPGAGFSTGPHLHWELRTNLAFTQNGWLKPDSLTINNFGATPAKKWKAKTMFVVRNSVTNQVFTIGNQFIKHEQDATRAAIVCTALMGGPSNALTFDQFGFDVFCDSMGIPRGTAASLPPGGLWRSVADPAVIAAAVASAVGNVNVNMDAIASAIASKLGAPVSEPITKADIQAAIEANYKESK
jgi:hypothetical protein